MYGDYPPILNSLTCELQVEAVSEAFKNFQVKTYGKETQVHDTPEKKKRKKA